MKFQARDIRAIVSIDENGNYSQERVDAFQRFIEEERNVARGRGWANAVDFMTRTFRTAFPEMAFKIAQQGHMGNHYKND